MTSHMMKSLTSIALAVCFFVASVPVSAQQQGAYSTSLSNWARVRTIVPGTRISVGIAGPDEVEQYFLDATDETITLLDLTNRDLPRDARRVVIRTAAILPGLFTASRWIEVTDRHIRLNQDGVFVRGHRLVALEDVVKTIDRGDVGEISRLRRAPASRPRDISVPPEVVAGSILAASGVAAACNKRCDGGGGFILMLGALFGPATAWRIIRDRERVPELVYRAP
jgi:hypothetical protein